MSILQEPLERNGKPRQEAILVFLDLSSLLLDNPPGLHYGAAAVDLDQDGTFELVIANFLGPNRIFKWTGEGLVALADPALQDTKRKAVGVAAADLTGNGAEELYFLTADTFAGPKSEGDTLLFNGPQGWVDLFARIENVEFANLTSGRSVAALDRFGQGRYGFVVANFLGPMALFETDQEGRVRDLAREAQIARTTGGRALLPAPLFGGSRLDLFCHNEKGSNFLYRNRGDGTFEEVADQCGLSDAHQNGRGVALLDSGRDGRFDLVCGNWEGPHRLYRQRERGRFEECAPPHMSRPSRVRNVVVADFDNDGHHEIFFHNLGEPNRLFAWRQGGWVELDCGAASEPGQAGTGALVGDFDQDGSLELLLCHGESEMAPLTLYRAPSSGHSCRVLPLTAAGAPARGARVTLRAKAREQTRIIDAGSGYLCQMEPVAHFGLVPNSSCDWIEVIWPDGAHRRLDRPQVDHLVKVDHP